MLSEKQLTPMIFSNDIQGYSALEVSHVCVYLLVYVCACVSVARSVCRILYLLPSTRKKYLASEKLMPGLTYSIRVASRLKCTILKIEVILRIYFIDNVMGISHT